MPTGPRECELWDGKNVIGIILITTEFCGLATEFHISPGVLKEGYGKRYETIELKHEYRLIKDDGIDFTQRRVFSTRRKSKRQISDILQVFGKR